MVSDALSFFRGGLSVPCNVLADEDATGLDGYESVDT